MNKNILIFAIAFAGTLLLNSCGYQKINERGSNKYYIEKIIIKGEKKIGYLLKDDIGLYSSEQSANKITITLDTSLDKTIKNKSISGKVSRYEIQLQVNLTIKNINSDRVLEKNFYRVSNFDVANNHSKTINNEKTAKKSLSSTIAGDIVNFMNVYYE